MERDELLISLMDTEAGKELLYTMYKNVVTICFALQGDAYTCKREGKIDKHEKLLKLANRINELALKT